MRGPLKRRRQNSSFNCLSLTHQIFRIGKYEGEVKFDKVLGTKMRVPQVMVPQGQNEGPNEGEGPSGS